MELRFGNAIFIQKIAKADGIGRKIELDTQGLATQFSKILGW